MKKIFLSIGLGVILASCGGTKNPQLQTLKSRQEVLKLNTDVVFHEVVYEFVTKLAK